ncbi:MAG: hypothetical protein Q4E17_05070 [Synergistes sp.]|nr:hypothetical protein [Synergistes sp.]
MNILFCSEGFIIDGVATYNVHMSAALHLAGHRTAILGRWLGFHGLQRQHRRLGVEVLQYYSPFVVCDHAVKMGVSFQPDAIITDGRRGFPLALAIHQETGAPIYTNFMDDVTGKNKPGRTIDEIITNSVALTSPEERFVKEAENISACRLPVRKIRRAIVPELLPELAPPYRSPFRVLCIGRTSRFKFRGQLSIVKNALRLMRYIPDIEITVVGGGWRLAYFMKEALEANIRAGRRLIRIAGYQADPAPYIARSTVVCGGSTCGLEGILSCRPVIAMSGFFLGLITPENLDRAVETYYAERDGDQGIGIGDDRAVEALIDLYERWNDEDIATMTKTLHDSIRPRFSPQSAAEEWLSLIVQH